MNIGIDARLYGLEHAGIGRYVKNLVDRMIRLDDAHTFTLFLKEPYYSTLKGGSHIHKVLAAIRHYTLKEQLFMPGIFNAANLDILHVPHFNVPLFYQKPFVVTIHDILWHHYQGSTVTTLSPLMYRLKYRGYKQVVSHAVFASQAIVVPSRFVKDQLVQEFPSLPESKISVTHEGVDINFTLSPEPQSSDPYLLYVGSCYPHKNLSTLLRALKIYNQTHKPVALIIVSARNVFLKKLELEVTNLKLENQVQFKGKLSDSDLRLTYRKSLALLQPSLSEGFGLTGLEAMALGVPVIAAKAGSLPEIYGDAALWFNPHNPHDLAEKIEAIHHEPVRRRLIEGGMVQVKKFSWDTLVQKTLSLYSQTLAHHLS